MLKHNKVEYKELWLIFHTKHRDITGSLTIIILYSSHVVVITHAH